VDNEALGLIIDPKFEGDPMQGIKKLLGLSATKKDGKTLEIGLKPF